MKRKNQGTDNLIAEGRKFAVREHLGCLDNLLIVIEIDHVEGKDARHLRSGRQRLQPKA